MKRTLLLTCAGLFSAQAFAGPVYHPYGPNLTYGSVSNGQSIMSEVTNPAAGAATAEKHDVSFRFGILSNIGVGYELGDVDSMFDELDVVIDNLSDDFANVNNAVAAEVEGAVNEANDLLSNIQDDGYAKAFVSANIPLMPLSISSGFLGGTLVFDANISIVAKVSTFSDPISFSGADVTAAQNFIDTAIINDVDAQGTFGDMTIRYVDLDNSIEYDVNNDSSMIARAARITEFSFGYSRPVTKFMGGDVYAGVRGNFYKVLLLQDAERVVESEETAEDYFDDLDPDDGEENTGVGIDFGMLWTTDHLRLGATLKNINEPEFEYNDFDTSDFSDPATIALLNELSGAKYTMETQATVEAAFHSKNQHWVIAGSLDLNEVEDPIGDEYQWAAVSAAYIADSWWLPGVRVGYRVNQAGSELKYLTGGLTLFKELNLDVAYSPEKVKDDDGDEVTRSIIFNLGLDMTF